MKPEEFSKRMDEILLKLHKRELYLETAKTELLRLFREVVPPIIDPSLKSYSHDRTQMNLGWNNCIKSILSSLPQESE